MHALRPHSEQALTGRAPWKRTVSSVIGSVEGATTAMFRDTLVKDALADYASEQFEVACYRVGVIVPRDTS